MKKTGTILLLIGCLSSFCMGQTKSSYTLSGTVVNGLNNSILSGANIVSSRKVGVRTNELGEFAISVYPSDTLSISFVGFKTLTYIAPQKDSGKYLIKFKLYRDSISLKEVDVFPFPSYKDFKKAFLAMNKENEKIKMEGVKMYQDKVTTPSPPSILSPASFIYDKLFDKKAKLKRRLARRRKTIKLSEE